MTMSPPPPPSHGFNDIGPQPSQAPAHHHRTPSQVPLLGAVDLAGAGAEATSAFISSQPSSSVSQPMTTQAPQGQTQGYLPSNYPPALQSWAANQGAIQSSGAANTQRGFNAPGVQASGSGQATGSVPTSSLVPNTSVGSMGTEPSTYTTPSWVGSTGPYQPPIIPIIGGPAQQRQHETRFNNTGSPVSHDQWILQHADPSSYPIDIYDPNVYYSSSSDGPSSVGGSSQAASRNGKGRPLVVVGEKAPVVHLDGGIFEDRQPEPVPVPAPPAYSE